MQTGYLELSQAGWSVHIDGWQCVRATATLFDAFFWQDVLQSLSIAVAVSCAFCNFFRHVYVHTHDADLHKPFI